MSRFWIGWLDWSRTSSKRWSLFLAWCRSLGTRRRMIIVLLRLWCLVCLAVKHRVRCVRGRWWCISCFRWQSVHLPVFEELLDKLMSIDFVGLIKLRGYVLLHCLRIQLSDGWSSWGRLLWLLLSLLQDRVLITRTCGCSVSAVALSTGWVRSRGVGCILRVLRCVDQLLL